MKGMLRVLACGCLLLACAAPRAVAPVQLERDAGECAADKGKTCYERGKALLQSRKPEVAQESMELVDKACAAGSKEACDLAELAFRAPRRIAGRTARIPSRLREEHVHGTVVARCTLDVQGKLTDCAIVESVPEMDAEVLDSISTRQYEPAAWGGNPVEVPFDVRVDVSP